MYPEQFGLAEDILVDVKGVDVNVGKLDDPRLVLDGNQLGQEVTILMLSDCFPPGHSTFKSKSNIGFSRSFKSHLN